MVPLGPPGPLVFLGEGEALGALGAPGLLGPWGLLGALGALGAPGPPGPLDTPWELLGATEGPWGGGWGALSSWAVACGICCS